LEYFSKFCTKGRVTNCAYGESSVYYYYSIFSFYFVEGFVFILFI